MSAPDKVPGALAGIRVLEISSLAGACCGRVLADLGATVIKIEPPGGEPARQEHPLVPVKGGMESANWLAYNYGKQSITLDLHKREGIERFRELAAISDVVICDFERLSIDEMDRLGGIARAANPCGIWTEILPFGRGGSYERLAATDTVLQALGGHLYLNGDVDRAPVRIGLPVAMIQSGAEAASATLMALYHALRTGEGQRVDVSAHECIVWTLLNTTMAWQILGLNEMRGGAVRKERANRFFTRLVWECRDGYIFCGPVGGGGGAARIKSYASLTHWMSSEGFADEILIKHDWNGDGQFDIPQDDYDEVSALIARFFLTKTTEELMSRAVADRILLAPISSIADVMHNPQFKARGLFSELEDTARGLNVQLPNHWVHMSATGLTSPSAAPMAGADTEAVLALISQKAHEPVEAA